MPGRPPAADVPFAVRPTPQVRPDLWPLSRPPAHAHDPGPPTWLRDVVGTDELVAAARHAVTTAPQRWTTDDLGDELARAAGAALAHAAAAAVPGRLDVDDLTVHVRDVGVTVHHDGRLDGPTAAAPVGAAVVRRRLEALPAARRVLGAVAAAVGEDLVLVDRSGDVRWAHVCAPSGWDPGASAGVALTALHAPVPGADRLRAASRNLAAAIVGSGPHVRYVWGLAGTDRLDRHAADPPCPPDLAADPGTWTLRTERQTTHPLAEVDLGAFAIRVARAPLADVLAVEAGRSVVLAEAVASLPDDLAAYKGLDGDRRSTLQAWLAARPAQ